MVIALSYQHSWQPGFGSRQDLPTPSTPELLIINEKIHSLLFNAFILGKRFEEKK